MMTKSDGAYSKNLSRRIVFSACASLSSCHSRLKARVDEICAQQSGIFAHPFDDLDLIRGHGSLGLEILKDAPDVDVIICTYVK